MPAKKIDFPCAQITSSKLCFDTSFVIEVYYSPKDPLQATKRKKDCDAFLDQLIKEDKTCHITFSVYGEMLDKIIEDVIAENIFKHIGLHNYRSIWRDYYKANKKKIPGLDNRLNDSMEKFNKWLGDHRIYILPFSHDPTSSIMPQKNLTYTSEIAEYCKKYKILSDDARIIIEARHKGIDSFVSLDWDFLGVDGIIVYTHK